MTEADENKAAAESLDLIWGAAAIAQAIGKSRRATYGLLENGHLPVAKKQGDQWVVSRRKLREHFEGAGA